MRHKKTYLSQKAAKRMRKVKRGTSLLIASEEEPSRKLPSAPHSITAYSRVLVIYKHFLPTDRRPRGLVGLSLRPIISVHVAQMWNRLRAPSGIKKRKEIYLSYSPVSAPHESYSHIPDRTHWISKSFVSPTFNPTHIHIAQGRSSQNVSIHFTHFINIHINKSFVNLEETKLFWLLLLLILHISGFDFPCAGTHLLLSSFCAIFYWKDNVEWLIQ